jgi:hypothetical protein
MAKLLTSPFFIVGHPRSGTTLLRFLLSGHPNIHIPEETGFIPFLVGREELDAELSLAQVRVILDRIGRLNRFWHGMVGDVAAFYQALPEPKLTYVLDALYRQQIAEYGASRWGDKTPLYIRYIRTLNEIFPTAQFVHLVRDGRDATLSALEKWPHRRWYMDSYYLLKNWVRNIEAGHQAARDLGPNRYLEVRYETLVQHPQQVLEQICEFLGEEFRPDMLDQAQAGTAFQSHAEVQRPVSTASVQRWRTQMSPFDQKMADQLAGQTLSALGYELARLGPFSAVERLKLFLMLTKYLLTNTSRRVLYALGILTLNRDMRR